MANVCVGHTGFREMQDSLQTHRTFSGLAFLSISKRNWRIFPEKKGVKLVIIGILFQNIKSNPFFSSFLPLTNSNLQNILRNGSWDYFCQHRFYPQNENLPRILVLPNSSWKSTTTIWIHHISPYGTEWFRSNIYGQNGEEKKKEQTRDK